MLREICRPSLLLVILAVGACDRSTRLPEYALTGSSMGTTFSVKIIAPPENLAEEPLREEIDATLTRVEQLTSTYLIGSELSVFNATRSTDWVTVSEEFCEVIAQALEISHRTGGAFDITVGPLVNLWGFGPDGVVLEPPSDEAIAAALRRVGFTRLETRCKSAEMRKDTPDLYVDLSGWAKGYAVDQIAALLDGHDLHHYLVEIGGELRASGHNAEALEWSIAIEKPLDDERRPQTILRLTDRAMATSGDYRNYFDFGGQRFSHTIDVRTGRPVAHALAAVTVIDDSAATADALATALLVLGPETGLELAEELGIAGYFLVREPAGLDALSSSQFTAMTTLP